MPITTGSEEGSIAYTAPRIVLPPLSAQQASDLVHQGLWGRVAFIPFPANYRDLDGDELFERFYEEDPRTLFHFLFGLQGSGYLHGLSTARIPMQSFAMELQGRVLLDTNGVWVATTDAQRSELIAYASAIWSWPRQVRMMLYSSVKTEWLYPARFTRSGSLVPVSNWRRHESL